MLFPQPGMLFPSLIPCPALIHAEEAQHRCPLLSAAFPASGKSPSAHCTRSWVPQAGGGCVWLRRLWNTQGPSSFGASSVFVPGWDTRGLLQPAQQETPWWPWSLCPWLPLLSCPSLHQPLQRLQPPPHFTEGETEGLQVNDLLWPPQPREERGKPQSHVSFVLWAAADSASGC